MQCAILEERLLRVDAGARRKTLNEDELEFADGDVIDVYREPANKDIHGWRGPADLVKLQVGKPDAVVRWGGRVFELPKNLIRRHDGFCLFTGFSGGARVLILMRWIDNLEAAWGKSLLLGLVTTPNGLVAARGNTVYPDLWYEVQNVASKAGLAMDGALMGSGISYLNPLSKEGALLLLYWRTGGWSTLAYRELRCHWGVNLSKYCEEVGAPCAEEVSFIAFYAYGRLSVYDQPFNEFLPFPAEVPVSSLPASSSSASSSSSAQGSQSGASTAAQNIQREFARRLAGTGPRLGQVIGSAVGAHAGEAVRPWGLGEGVLPLSMDEISSIAGGHLGERVGARVGDIVDRVTSAGARRIDGLMDSVGRARPPAASGGSSTPSPDPSQSQGTPSSSAPVNFSGKNQKKEIFNGTTGGKEGRVLYSKMTNDLAATEILVAWNNDEVSTSLARAAYLSQRKMKDTKELTKEEERLFSWECDMAKIKELLSFCQNEAMEIVRSNSIPVRIQGSRWVLTWKRVKTPQGEYWSVKARLVIRGFEDEQASELRVRSPTAGRTGQRLVLSVSAITGWPLVSVDLPTAFLQGRRLDDEATESGLQRIAAMRPPSDAWRLLPQEWRLWPGLKTEDFCWRLLVAVYGLKDAPKLFINMLCDWLRSEGWIVSVLDEQVFYLRFNGELAGILSVHMDDLAMSAVPKLLDRSIENMKKRWGQHAEVRVQREVFQHLGYDYNIFKDGSCSMDLKTFISEMKKGDILSVLTEPLPPRGVTILRSINGNLSYATGARPDALGSVAESASAVGVRADGSGPTWQDVANANDVVDWMQATNSESQLWYPRIGGGKIPKSGEKCPWLSLLVLSDAAFSNLHDRHSQLGYTILLVEMHDPSQFGGRVHVIEFGSKRSTRVTVSTFSGELQAALMGLERGQLVQYWMSEVWNGVPDGLEGLMHGEPAVRLETGVDARGLFDCLTAANIGKLTDKSTTLYVLAYRQSLHSKVVERMSWVPTESMLADDTTKNMKHGGSGLWPVVYQCAYWQCFRRTDLKEDWVTWESSTGEVCRWHLGDLVLNLLHGNEGSSQTW